MAKKKKKVLKLIYHRRWFKPFLRKPRISVKHYSTIGQDVSLFYFRVWKYDIKMQTIPFSITLRKQCARQLMRLTRAFTFSRFSIPVTRKPREMRMGKGKGGLSLFLRPHYFGAPFFRVWYSQKVPFFTVVQTFLKIRIRIAHCQT